MRTTAAALLLTSFACSGDASPATGGDAWVAERDTVGDTVWAAVEDADGVRYVKRLEIARAPADSIGRD
ncbi:MAG TPA: hypothetical protein VFN06_05785, partial [Gaiellaceae bacterium]|nr:hypothetical protein [Gaiellaceae bacterium]